MASISLVLRKEIAEKVVIGTNPFPGFLEQGKDSLEESFVNAKDELALGTSAGTTN